MSAGKEFQTDGAATEKARRASSVRVRGTASSGASDERSRKSYVLFRTVPFPMTVSDSESSFQHPENAPEQSRKMLHASPTSH